MSYHSSLHYNSLLRHHLYGSFRILLFRRRRLLVNILRMIFLISLTSWLCGYLTASFPSLQSEQQGESFRSTDWQVNSSVPIERQAESYLPTEKHVDIAIRVRELRVSLEKRFPKE